MKGNSPFPKLGFIALLILLCVNQSLAQGTKATLRGKIVNSETGSPMDYTTIILPDCNMWAISNEKG